MPNQAKKDPKIVKKTCLKCGDSFRTKQLRLNHELLCKAIKPSQTEALNKAWNALTPDQQAEYGSPEKLHESCLKMIDKLTPMMGE